MGRYSSTGDSTFDADTQVFATSGTGLEYRAVYDGHWLGTTLRSRYAARSPVGKRKPATQLLGFPVSACRRHRLKTHPGVGILSLELRHPSFPLSNTNEVKA
jgi:hypothetical protein